jgi:hypothetical protein
MKLKCDRCLQKYFIPEDKISDKRSFFICEKCGNRIVVDPHDEIDFMDTFPDEEKRGAGSIAEYICHAFSLKSTGTAFIFIYLIALITSLTLYLVSKNYQFFASHQVFSGISAFILIIILKYAWDFMLYLISLNAFYRFNYERDITYASIPQKIISDSSIILFFSSAGLTLLVFLLIPVYLLKGSGPFYASIFFPFLIAASALLVWPYMTRGFLYALIAGRMRSLKNTFRVIGDFIYTENINIPVYAVIIRVVTFFISIILYAAVSAPVIAAAVMTGIFTDTGAASTAYYHEAAAYFLIFFISLIIVFIVSSLTVLRQTLRCAAVKIMENSPGESVSGRSKIIAMFALAAFMILVSGVTVLIFTSTGFTALFSAAALGSVIQQMF